MVPIGEEAGWVPRASLDILKDRRICSPYWDLNNCLADCIVTTPTSLWRREALVPVRNHTGTSSVRPVSYLPCGLHSPKLLVQIGLTAAICFSFSCE
jgi:hypothetical protein